MATIEEFCNFIRLPSFKESNKLTHVGVVYKAHRRVEIYKLRSFTPLSDFNQENSQLI